MKMTLNRNYVLPTPAGLHFRFVKGEATEIPAKFVQLALNIGAEAVAEARAEADAIQAETDKEVLEEARRAQKLRKAIEEMVDRNHSGDFTAGGRPNLKRLSALVGFDPDRDEVEKVFDDLRNEKANA